MTVQALYNALLVTFFVLLGTGYAQAQDANFCSSRLTVAESKLDATAVLDGIATEIPSILAKRLPRGGSIESQRWVEGYGWFESLLVAEKLGQTEIQKWRDRLGWNNYQKFEPKENGAVEIQSWRDGSGFQAAQRYIVKDGSTELEKWQDGLGWTNFRRISQCDDGLTIHRWIDGLGWANSQKLIARKDQIVLQEWADGRGWQSIGYLDLGRTEVELNPMYGGFGSRSPYHFVIKNMTPMSKETLARLLDFLIK